MMEPTRKEVVLGGAGLWAMALAGRAEAQEAALHGEVVKNLPSKDQIWAWEEQLGLWAPCFTGNAGHRAFTQFIAEQFVAAGISPQRKDFAINLWDPKIWTLKLNGKSDVPVTSYRPYSGPTGPEGVAGEMVYVGKVGGAIDWSNIKGKIALVDTPAPA